MGRSVNPRSVDPLRGPLGHHTVGTTHIGTIPWTPHRGHYHTLAPHLGHHHLGHHTVAPRRRRTPFSATRREQPPGGSVALAGDAGCGVVAMSLTLLHNPQPSPSTRPGRKGRLAVPDHAHEGRGPWREVRGPREEEERRFSCFDGTKEPWLLRKEIARLATNTNAQAPP
jgi:hypothetical protein